MEEDEYKTTYNDLTEVRCVFEKALTNNLAKCDLSSHFCLADREGYSCQNTDASKKCTEVLKKLRQKSVFALKIRDADGPLPHNMEIRVQAGGVIGLAKLGSIQADSQQPVFEQAMVENIYGVLDKAIAQFGSLDMLPYGEIIQSVVQFQGRRRRQR